MLLANSFAGIDRKYAGATRPEQIILPSDGMASPIWIMEGNDGSPLRAGWAFQPGSRMEYEGSFILAFFLDFTGVELHHWIGMIGGALAAYPLVSHRQWISAGLDSASSSTAGSVMWASTIGYQNSDLRRIG